jgi:hypothetical protein
VIKFLLYLVRWQLSTPVLAPIVAYFKHSGSIFGTKEDWIAATIANLIGACIFFWVDRFIFRSQMVERWEIIKRDQCFDCGKVGLVRRLVMAPGGYDRADHRTPEYRCEVCSKKKLEQLIRDKKVKV